MFTGDDRIYCLYSAFRINEMTFDMYVFPFSMCYAFPVIMVLAISSAADFDLTGQLVWPGAMLLNDYISKNSELLQGRSVIELGSGVGKYL